MLREDRRTAEGRARTRRYGKLSIVAAAVLVIWGVALLLILPRPAAGIICIVFGAVGLLMWAVLWPLYRRRGLV